MYLCVKCNYGYGYVRRVCGDIVFVSVKYGMNFVYVVICVIVSVWFLFIIGFCGVIKVIIVGML